MGLVALKDARQVGREERAWRSVAAIMTPAEQLVTVAPGDTATEALRMLSRRTVDQLPVVEDGDLRGLLRREDLVKWLILRGPDTSSRVLA